MRIEDMTKNQKIILFVVLSGAWVGFLWYWHGRRPQEEQQVVSRLRNAKAVTVEIMLQRGGSELEQLTGDRDALARTFRIVEGTAVNAGAQVSVPIRDTDESAVDAIVWLFPPDIANIGGRLFKIDPGFWPALLDRAPKTKEWWEKAPKNVPARPPGNRRPKAAAPQKPVAKK